MKQLTYSPYYSLTHVFYIYLTSQIDEVYNFSQDDLLTEDILILDTHAEVLVWVGQSVDPKYKQSAFEIGQVSFSFFLVVNAVQAVYSFWTYDSSARELGVAQPREKVLNFNILLLNFHFCQNKYICTCIYSNFVLFLAEIYRYGCIAGWVVSTCAIVQSHGRT